MTPHDSRFTTWQKGKYAAAKIEARRWFNPTDRTFTLACEAVGMDPGKVARKAKTLFSRADQGVFNIKDLFPDA